MNALSDGAINGVARTLDTTCRTELPTEISQPPVPPSVAAASSNRCRQAHPGTLLSEPFSDFNAVKAAKPISFPDRPAPDSLPERGLLHTIFMGVCHSL